MKKKWVIRGLIWGWLTYLSVTIAMAIFQGEHLSAGRIAGELALWTVFGLLWGYTMNFYENSSKPRTPTN